MYWHWRTLSPTPYFPLTKADSPLPSQRTPVIPTDSGVCRKTELISSSCLSFSLRGRPERSPSTNPPSPFSSKRRTQYSTVRGASPRRRLTSGHVIPWATNRTPWSRWSYRDSPERRISSCNPRTIVGASATMSGFMISKNIIFLNHTQLLNALCINQLCNIPLTLSPSKGERNPPMLRLAA